MLYLTVKGDEYINEFNEVVHIKDQKLQLEHSLVSLSRWEAIHKKAFLDERNVLTRDETLDYFRCMTITQNVDPAVYERITDEQIKEINRYINDPMTATTINNPADGGSGTRHREIYTSEVIYQMMIANNIPVEFQKWHLNRLLTLIQVCGIKNNPPKKMSKQDLMRRNRELNAARRKKLGSKG